MLHPDAEPASVISPPGADGAVARPSSDAKNPPASATAQSPLRLWVLVRLALVNSIGYSGSTIVPLWVGGVSLHMGMPPWFGGAVATGQLAAAALFNLLTPILFPAIHPARLAKVALAGATVVFLFAVTGQSLIFTLACVAGGACLGLALNATNRIIAGSAEVQKGYSIFLLTEGVFSASLFYAGALLWRRVGLNAVFLTLPAVACVGAIVMTSLPGAQIFCRPALVNVSSRRMELHPILGMLALFLFFCGQSCMTASTLALGAEAGMSPQTASALLAINVIVGLLGAAAARLLGERFGVRGPIMTATLILMCVVTAMTQAPAPAMFFLGVMWLQVTTLFIVPYFLTLLARLDDTGRAASVGPAFLLAGVAIGPSLAAGVIGRWSPAALGPAASSALLCSAALTLAATSRRVPSAT